MNAASLRIRKVLMVSKGYLQEFPECPHRDGVISVAGVHMNDTEIQTAKVCFELAFVSTLSKFSFRRGARPARG